MKSLILHTEKVINIYKEAAFPGYIIQFRDTGNVAKILSIDDSCVKVEYINGLFDTKYKTMNKKQMNKRFYILER